MGHRYNERNAGHWSLESEPKTRATSKKVSRSFTEAETEMFKYIINQVADNIELDATDKNDQVYRDNGQILIQFSRDDIEAFRSLINKF